MSRVPFIGRLFFREYLALVGSFVLVGLESIVRIITLALPGPVLRLFYNGSRSAFNLLSSPAGRRSRERKKDVVSSIAQSTDFSELCELFGYHAEEHVVQTGDGYFLGLHRLGWRKGEEDQRVNSGRGSIEKKVVYLHHGLMMNSEAWVCLTEKGRCLPFMLVERGYDVWFGNNRGNKYSKKCVHCSPAEIRFWNFSMDQFAFHDIPDSIEYILSTTKQRSLSYIGFSQGTAQAFATLSIHPTLNEKIDVFIALAPAMSPSGMANGIVDSLVKASPSLLFLVFGRRSILSSATVWQALLYPPIFVRFIDVGLKFLFGWHAKNMTPHQKLAAYPHLYSFTSTKSVVHWFQIIGNGTFQMYDDEVQAPLSIAQGAKFYKVAKYPTRNIKTPIVLVYGGSDSLVDIKVMLKELPRHTIAREIPHYEHLDFLWASDVDQLVFPHVFDALESFAHGGEKDLPAPFSKTHRQTPKVTGPSSCSEDEKPKGRLAIDMNGKHSSTESSSTQTTATPQKGVGRKQSTLHENARRNRRSQGSTSIPGPSRPDFRPETHFGSADEISLSTSTDTSPPRMKHGAPFESRSPAGRPRSIRSHQSTSSLSSTTFGEKGIVPGASKALSGILSKDYASAKSGSEGRGRTKTSHG